MSKRPTNAYAEAAPLHGACGMKHYAVDECDPTARVARRCPYAACKKRLTTKRAYDNHLSNRHGVLAYDLHRLFVDGSI